MSADTSIPLIPSRCPGQLDKLSQRGIFAQQAGLDQERPRVDECCSDVTTVDGCQGCKRQSVWDNCTRMRSKVRQVVITALLALVVAICVPVFVHRHDFDVALSGWMKDQSTEKTAVLNEEARKSRWIVLKTQIKAGCVTFLLLNGGWFVMRRIMRSGTSSAPQSSQ